MGTPSNGEERLIPVSGGDKPDAEMLVRKDEDFSQNAEPVEEAEAALESPTEHAVSREAELEDRLLRTMADFDNYRKRSARQTEEIVKTANDRLLVEILDIIDNLERAMQHADNGAADAESLHKGMELIYNQFVALLARYDVTPIEAVGKKFDPDYHDAMMQVESDKYDEGIVAVEMTKGYRRGDQVIRHSKVGVSTGKKKGGK